MEKTNFPVFLQALNMFFSLPRITIAALRGGSGKTMLSLGLVAAWRSLGRRTAPFKKGPDFIDAGWLTFASGRSCHNLDPFMMNKKQMLQSFFSHSNHADLSLIEGNRGLFDGLDVEGRFCTAELAKFLESPVLLILDVTMTTRTVAAIIMGCKTFDPALVLAGVVLNRVAGSRQETLIRKSIKKYCGIPVVGSIPKLDEDTFPERHMGLIPYQEISRAEEAVSWARKTVQENLELDEIWEIAVKAESIEQKFNYIQPGSEALAFHDPLRIGFIRDSAFSFYYPENLEQLRQRGATLIELNAVSDNELPELDALYIGGGFPETQARELALNLDFKTSLKKEIEKGLPVYAECGGFMYLGESLLVDGKTYPMTGALPVRFNLEKRPLGHGYTVLEVNRTNPYYKVGDTLKGHEFHYSKAIFTGREDVNFVFKIKRGFGVDGKRDGICKKNVLATYTHLHAAGEPRWAEGLIRTAMEYKKTGNLSQVSGSTLQL